MPTNKDGDNDKHKNNTQTYEEKELEILRQAVLKTGKASK